MSQAEMQAGPATSEVCPPPHLNKPRLRRAEVSEYLEAVFGIELAPQTLARFATTGAGPGFQKSGSRPLYPRAEVDRWALARLGKVRHSTSER